MISYRRKGPRTWSVIFADGLGTLYMYDVGRKPLGVAHYSERTPHPSEWMKWSLPSRINVELAIGVVNARTLFAQLARDQRLRARLAQHRGRRR